MELSRVQHYLTSRLGKPVVVRSVKRSFPGASRETWLIRCEAEGRREEGFVLRVDPPEGAGCAGDLKQEFAVYAKLFQSEVPVAELLWYDEGQDMGEGRPHMVRRMVDGSSNVAGLFDDDADAPARRRAVAYECIEKLALVHKLDWKAHGFDDLLPAPETAAESFAHELAIWKDHWRTRRPFPSPILEETLSWLGEIVPHDTPRISLVKGNNGLGEEIWQGEKIVAMSDWEALAHAEQAPANDLTAQYAAGRILKSALSAFIEAREEGRAGGAGLVEPLRACLRQVAQHEQAVALRAGGMTPF